MTLDLNELERKARWFRDECSTPITGPDPDDVIALIERVRGLEKAIATMTGEYDDLRDQARERGLND